MVLILGIESSCDETSVAVVDDSRRILSNIVRSQYEAHAPYGGVVPEIAARSHIEWMQPVLEQALREAKCSAADMDAIAVTAGPGLIGGVIVGVMTAKTLASIYSKPLIAVNHLEGHALTARLTDNVAFPYLLLLVSGGHCLFALVEEVGRYEILGGTVDDALGEAFDKCAKMLQLPYPGGPAIEAIAAKGNPDAYPLPRPLLHQAGCHMSFSGLKTAVRTHIRQLESTGPLGEAHKADIAASFQAAVLDVLSDRTRYALEQASASYQRSVPLVIAGGVAANQAIKQRLTDVAAAYGSECVVPKPSLCTDNAAMIAWAGIERFHRGLTDPLCVEPRARWPLSELASPGVSNP